MKKPAICLDLDGTLCNIEHRRWLIQQSPKDWKTFFERMVDDKPNEMVKAAVWGLVENYGYDLLFCTGRHEKWREVTKEWLRTYCRDLFCSRGKLFMRADDDFRPDDVVKEEIYKQQIEPHYNVHLVIDDRKKVYQMWRKLGLECWAVAEGDY